MLVPYPGGELKPVHHQSLSRRLGKPTPKDHAARRKPILQHKPHYSPHMIACPFDHRLVLRVYRSADPTCIRSESHNVSSLALHSSLSMIANPTSSLMVSPQQIVRCWWHIYTLFKHQIHRPPNPMHTNSITTTFILRPISHVLWTKKVKCTLLKSGSFHKWTFVGNKRPP